MTWKDMRRHEKTRNDTKWHKMIQNDTKWQDATWDEKTWHDKDMRHYIIWNMNLNQNKTF
jgi:hypothetical protein